MLNHNEILRYSRHLLIPEVGLDGQQKLKAASALIIGTGGLGSPVALYTSRPGFDGHPFRPPGLPAELIREIDDHFGGLYRGQDSSDIRSPPRRIGLASRARSVLI